jgi:hypothetical protein
MPGPHVRGRGARRPPLDDLPEADAAEEAPADDLGLGVGRDDLPPHAALPVHAAELVRDLLGLALLARGQELERATAERGHPLLAAAVDAIVRQELVDERGGAREDPVVVLAHHAHDLVDLIDLPEERHDRQVAVLAILRRQVRVVLRGHGWRVRRPA